MSAHDYHSEDFTLGMLGVLAGAAIVLVGLAGAGLVLALVGWL